MPSIEIVVHCYRYSRLLRYQLESLYRNYWSVKDSTVRPVVSIYCDLADTPTMLVAAEYRLRTDLGVTINTLPLESLFVRAIGRHRAALATTADWIWFADCDYLFGPRCLRQLAAMDSSEPPSAVDGVDSPCPLRFPRFVQTCRTHAIGDGYLDRVGENGLPPYERLFDPDDFYPRGMHKAIGGIQIAPGWAAREKGYCPAGSKWLRPVNNPVQFLDTVSDRVFRCQMGGYGTPIDLSDVYRLRHSRSFRDAGGADN